MSDKPYPYIPLGRNPYAVDVMEKGCDLLRQLDMKWWLSAGTILGIQRDDELIYHDTDIDVGTLDRQDILPKLDDLFRKGGFRPVRSTPFQRAFLRLGVIFDVAFFVSRGNEVFSVVDERKIAKPARFVENLGSVKFQGRVYPTPSPIDDYLEFRYGPDWRTPKTEKDYWVEDAACL